jgi:mRNA-degrading endonuclease toxin of MazEF toxin-antitoxin module
MLEQIHTIDKKRLNKNFGKISEEKFRDILTAIMYSFGFN